MISNLSANCGHFYLIAGNMLFNIISLMTGLVMLKVGLVSKVLACIFLLDLFVVSSYVKGKMPIFLSHNTSPSLAILGLPTTARNMILGISFFDWAVLYGSSSVRRV
ncbi:unnamed protein product [Cuscuta europaea]|uniref:Uncharacterized protein n=1 Tax=Cuscuta europaea TaxID=41803 RepID=A0A9P1EHG9_CUSEU|nr:unnamed protein product [Cuscuta europaea]